MIWPERGMPSRFVRHGRTYITLEYAYACLNLFLRKHRGKPPTSEQFRQALKVRSTATAYSYLQRLKRAGLFCQQKCPRCLGSGFVRKTQ